MTKTPPRDDNSKQAHEPTQLSPGPPCICGHNYNYHSVVGFEPCRVKECECQSFCISNSQPSSMSYATKDGYYRTHKDLVDNTPVRPSDSLDEVNKIIGVWMYDQNAQVGPKRILEGNNFVLLAQKLNVLISHREAEAEQRGYERGLKTIDVTPNGKVTERQIGSVTVVADASDWKRIDDASDNYRQGQRDTLEGLRQFNGAIIHDCGRRVEGIIHRQIIDEQLAKLDQDGGK